MAILQETAQRVSQKLGSDFEKLTIDRIAVGLWVKKPDELLDVLSAGGSGYHFFDKLAPRIVIEKPLRD